jgi:ADP-ribose pyrophosphatase YjhB (NUDIX family)
MGYIRELRELVGHRPIIMVGSGVLIVRDDKVLLQRRKDNGLWGIPGGSLEPGESLEEAAIRETYEEVGLVIEKLTLFKVYSGKDQFYTYPNGDQIYDVCVAYLTRNFHGELQADASEVLELAFFPVAALPADLNPLDEQILFDLQRSILNTDGHG